MTTDPTTGFPERPDLASMTIRELLAELTRIENRLGSQRAATSYQTTPENARLERRMRAISAHLRERRRKDETGAADDDIADIAAEPGAEADRIEQSIPVDADPDEEYPRQSDVEPPV